MIFVDKLIEKIATRSKTDVRYVLSGSFWLVLGRVLTSGIGFFVTVAFANLLNPELFGTYKYIITIAGITAALSLNGMGGAIHRSISRGEQNVIPSMFKKAIFWGLPASTICLGAGIYYLYMDNQTLGYSLIIIAATNPLLSALGMSKNFFIASGHFKLAAIYHTIRFVSKSLVVVTVLYLSSNLESEALRIVLIVFSYFISGVVFDYLTYLHSIKVMGISRDDTHSEPTLRYAKHLSLLGAAQLIVGQLDQLLLWHFSGPVALATYTIASGPTRELRTISENMNNVIFPKISQKNINDAKTTVKRRSMHFFLIYLVMVIVYIISAPHLFNWFFPQYLDAIFPSQLLALVLLFQARRLFDMILFVHSGIRDRYIVTLPSQITRVIVMIIAIPLYGIYGAIFALLAAEVVTALAIIYSYRQFKRA